MQNTAGRGAFEAVVSGLIPKLPSEWPPKGPCVCVLGTFDGVHRGHQILLSGASEDARNRGVPLCILTFHPHPYVTLGRSFAGYVLPLEERVELLRQFGEVWQIEFTEDFARTSPENFLTLLQKAELTSVWVGHDYRYGAGGKGTVQHLQTYFESLGIPVRIQTPVVEDAVRFASSGLRQALQNGDLKEYERIAGRSYFLRGTVRHGDGRGRNLGYPTANLVAKDALLANGVYCVSVTGAFEGCGLANLGVAPTFGQGRDRVLEVHLPDIRGEEIYQKILRVCFHERLREEIEFPSHETLLMQLKSDFSRFRDWVNKVRISHE